MQASSANIIVVDYTNSHHASEMMRLLNEYALDPMGGGEALAPEVIDTLPAKLNKVSGAFSVLALVDDRGVGLINCLSSFSTFKAKPIINIHDIAVSEESRGLGVCGKMLDRVAQLAKDAGACKLTLEVLEGNEPAMLAYRKAGFDSYQLDPAMGRALFWEKSLN